MITETNQSKRQILKEAYNQIIEVARPGDVVFFITEGQAEIRFPRLRRAYRSWQGFNPIDNSRWHTAVMVEPEKESQGSQWRPHFIHAVTSGVQKTHITPSFFTTARSEDGTIVNKGRIEVIQNPDLIVEQREAIVKYVNGQIGKPFAPVDWRYLLLTITLGLPSAQLDPDKGVSCHGLAFNAYEQIGFTFPHEFNNAPVFNIGRWLGHPLGHPADKVNLRRLYVTDHKLYRDSRFSCVISVFEDDQNRQLQTVLNPGKYSWSPRLQEIYNCRS